MLKITSPHDPWWYTVLGDHNFEKKKGFFAWWYRWTSLPDPGAEATFEQLNLFRKSRTASAFLLYLALVLIIVAGVAQWGPNKQIWTVIYILYPVIALSCWLNQRGLVTLVGIMLSSGLLGGMCLTLFVTATHGGISSTDKDIIFLLFFDELFVAALLPVNWVFIVAIVNVLISLYILNIAPHTLEFAMMLPASYFSIIFRLMQIHFLVPVIMWVLENKCLAAIRRADRATETARLQHAFGVMEAEKAKAKEKLEQSIALITKTHAEVANGNLSARVPVEQGNNVLWAIAVPLNNLIHRYQQLLNRYQNQGHFVSIINMLAEQDPDFKRKITQALEQQHSLSSRAQS